MDSFLIISKLPEHAKEYADSLCKKEKIDKIDISIIESEKAVGIAQVRDFQKKIYLKPYKSEKKAVVLNAQNGLTTEAQNALLKVLEEPPVNTIIIILAGSIESILPTIISRCKIFSLDGKNKTDFELYKKIILSVNEKGTGERLKLAETYSKDKETALQFLEGMILASESLLRENPQLLEAAKLLQKTYSVVKNTNANLRLTMEHLLLNLE